MKKILLVAAIAALSAASSFAQCASGVTLATLISNGDCTITNSAGTWTIQNWSFTPGQQTGFGSALPSAADMLITINTNATLGSSGPGFSITASAANTTTNAWFDTVGGQQVNQTIQYKLGYHVFSGPTIQTIGNSVQGEEGNGSLKVQKLIQTLQGVNIYDLDIFYAGNPLGIITGTDPLLLSPVGGQASGFSVVDNIVISAGNNPNGAGMTSYTNWFVTENPVPEPMTFALMGVGLVGIAVLRRRK